MQKIIKNSAVISNYYLQQLALLCSLLFIQTTHTCQDFFTYRNFSYVPTFALPALLPPDRGISFEHPYTHTLLGGYIEPVFDHQSSCLSQNNDVYANNIFLFLNQTPVARFLMNTRLVLSLEPGTIGKCGYPLLFSTGYTANGISERVNSYPPRDFVSELSLSVACPTPQGYFYLYGGLPGAPVLNLLVQQRLPEFFMPTESITHRYITSTDIVYGTLNGGFQAYGLSIEGSLFSGRSQDEHYWRIKKPRGLSYAGRISYCYDTAFSAQISYGHLKDSDPIDPCITNNRFLFSASYTRWGDCLLWTTTGAYAYNKYCPGDTLHAALLESCFIYNDQHIIFGRYEYMQTESNLIPLCKEEQYETCSQVQKLGLGYRYQWQPIWHGLWSAGVAGDISFVPKHLTRYYQRHPFGIYLFLRVDLA